MRTRRQIQLGLGLPSSEVQMILISGNWLIGNERFVDIDEEMVMALSAPMHSRSFEDPPLFRRSR